MGAENQFFEARKIVFAASHVSGGELPPPGGSGVAVTRNAAVALVKFVTRSNLVQELLSDTNILHFYI